MRRNPNPTNINQHFTIQDTHVEKAGDEHEYHMVEVRDLRSDTAVALHPSEALELAQDLIAAAHQCMSCFEERERPGRIGR